MEGNIGKGIQEGSIETWGICALPKPGCPFQARLFGLVAVRLACAVSLATLQATLAGAQEGTLRLAGPERSPALTTRPLQLQHPFAAGLIPGGGARCSTMLC